MTTPQDRTAKKLSAGHYIYEGHAIWRPGRSGSWRIDGGAERFRNLAEACADIDGRKRS